MKIAILTPTFNYFSGIDRVVQQQAEEYVKKNNQVTIFCLESDIKPKKYIIKTLGMPRNPFLQRLYRLFFFLDIKTMNQYKRLKEFDIVVSHFYPMNLLAYKARKQYKIKYIYHNHGIDTSSYSNFFHKIYMGLFQIFTNITLKNVDKAYSVSTYLKDELKKTSGLDSEVVYNKIDKKIFNNKVKGNKIINRYNSKNKKILLYVGRIAPHKGIHLLLKSFNIIKNKIPNVKLLIVGKPTHNSYFNKIKRLANKEVIFTGYVDDEELPQYFAASDLYVTASLWEGFDIPAASAQKCGKKVVAFDIGSHPEIVKNGKLIKSGDVKEFANAAVEMLK